MPKIYCPVSGCHYWVGDGGYTMESLAKLKGHVTKDHKDLPFHLKRNTGGIVDSMISDALAALTDALGLPR